MSDFVEDVLVHHPLQDLTFLEVLAVELFVRFGLRVAALHLRMLLQARLLFLQHFLLLLALLPGVILVVRVVDVPLHDVRSELRARRWNRLGLNGTRRIVVGQSCALAKVELVGEFLLRPSWRSHRQILVLFIAFTFSLSASFRTFTKMILKQFSGFLRSQRLIFKSFKVK